MLAADSIQQEEFAEERVYASGTEQVSVDELVRTLISRSGRSRSEIAETQEIILDTNVDGARYLLVRVPPATQPAPSLSPREREIVRMVSQGYPNKLIADVLNISFWTVSTHLRRIFAKLGVTSRAQMVAQMLEVRTKRKPSRDHAATLDEIGHIQRKAV
jgi:DNA-binding CsgD family transcriptional regulator